MTNSSILSTLEILKLAADVSDWGYGRWVYDKWQEFNEKYFSNQLVPGGIFWGLTPHGRSLGYYEPWRNSITLHTSLLKPKDSAWGMRKILGVKFTSDVLLHEMLHQANYQLDSYLGSEPHNCMPWCVRVNHLIPLLGLETNLIAKPVKRRRVKEPKQKKGPGKIKWVSEPGCMTWKQIASFPHSLRPRGYYSPGAEDLEVAVGVVEKSVAL